ncbi:hypothetical protein ACFVZ3_37540 [Kitasatospora purpeofusca]|uniref:hypothetical protein n=1 Tax=Kitasatospora purpeofusca TaxID=67352 RepID=UPI00368F3F59
MTTAVGVREDLAFGGDTIKNMAKRKQWALITADELGEVVSSAEALGLRPADVGLMFEVPGGLSRLAGPIDTRQRELDILSLVISRLKTESETEEAVSARDVSLIGAWVAVGAKNRRTS